MGQCVPSWDMDDDHQSPTSTVYAAAASATAAAAKTSLRSHSNSTGVPDVSMLDYEVAELTWEKGQLSMHGLGPPRSFTKPLTSSVNNTALSSKYTWPDNKPRASGTLESIVNQATRALPANHHRNKIAASSTYIDDLVRWFDHHRNVAAGAAAAAATSATMTMDALVPCSNRSTTDRDQVTATTHVIDESHNYMPASRFGTCMVGSSTRVGSCSGDVQDHEDGVNNFLRVKRSRVARGVAAADPATAPEWSGREHSFSGSATFGRESLRVTLETTCDRDLGVNGNLTSTSQGSLGNTSSGGGRTGVRANTAADDHDSVCHSRPQMEEGDEDVKKKGTGKSSVSTKRSRAAVIHNQSERKRRDKINQRMKTLQKLVPNSSKTDKASMLDEVIDYLKQLQAQVQMVSRMNMPAAMMLPMAMQQQLQMSMMAPAMGLGMGMSPMGMGMGMGMDPVNPMGWPNIAGLSPVLHPSVSAFMPLTTSWDDGKPNNCIQPSPAALMTDPLYAFLACQSQPTTMDAYTRMAAMYQQLHQHPSSNTKN